MCMFLCWAFRSRSNRKDDSDLEVGLDIRMYRRMQYLYELNVPLRYRWNNPPLNWEMVCNNYKNIVYDIDYFKNDENLQALVALRETKKSIY